LCIQSFSSWGFEKLLLKLGSRARRGIIYGKYRSILADNHNGSKQKLTNTKTKDPIQ